MKNKLNPKAITFFIEGVLLLSLIIGMFSFSFAGIGQNLTVPTYLEIGNVFPEVLLVKLNEGTAIGLTANQTKQISCVGIVRDYNGNTDITSATAVLFDNVDSSFGAADDNNEHYTNSSCTLNYSFGSYSGYDSDLYMALANCTFDVWYYANPATWNCTLTANDSKEWQDTNSTTQSVSQLLSLMLPESINYGLVNATFVSDEQIANVTNVGNVQVNLSLRAYAVNSSGDPWAMNCTLGSVRNISLMYEKYNLTVSNAGTLNLAQFEATHTNVTNVSVVKALRLPYRQDDTNQFVDDTNSTYWRIYVPRGVAGNCTGNIVFGATVANGS